MFFTCEAFVYINGAWAGSGNELRLAPMRREVPVCYDSSEISAIILESIVEDFYIGLVPRVIMVAALTL